MAKDSRLDDISLLFVEDDVGFRELLRAKLMAWIDHSRMAAVGSLAAALDHLAKQPVSAVLLDLGLPDGHGPDLINKVLGAAGDAAVIVLTGHDDESLAIEAVQLGCQEYLTKDSAQPELLRRVIRHAIVRKELERRLRDQAEDLQAARADSARRQELLQTVLDSMEQGVVAFDKDLRLMAWNENFLRIRDYPQALAVMGTPFDDFMRHDAERFEFGPENPDAVTAFQVARARRSQPHAYERRRPNGRFIEVRGGPIAEGGFVSTYSDVTERRQATELLAERERELRGLFEGSPVGMAFERAGGAIAEINGRVTDLTGWSAQELRELRLDDLLADGKEMREVDRIFARDGKIGNREVRLRRNGWPRFFWALISIEPFDYRGEKGRIAWIMDITARKRAEEALASSERTLRRILETTAEGFWMVDNEGILLDANPSFCRIVGIDLADLIGRRMSEMFDEDGRALCRAWFAEGRTDLPRGQEMTLLRGDGGRVPCLFNVTPLLDETGSRVGAFGLISDISPLKDALSHFEAAKEEAEQANRAKTEFLSNMSHELRTPLNSILGFSQLLDRDRVNPLTDQQRNFIQFVLKAGDHLLALIDEVLDLAKIESGRLKLAIGPISLRDILDGSLSFVESVAERQGIGIEDLTQGQDLPLILADPTRAKQVLLNLLSNAVKYNSEAGKVRVSVARDGPKHLQVTIADTGPGIAKELQSQLFQPFNRLGAEQTGIEGTGIGLALTRQLVWQMNGDIGFESTPGEGTKFWISFPMAEPSEAAATAPVAEAPGLGLAKATRDTAPETEVDARTRQRILYIEDNLVNRTLMEAIVAKVPWLEYAAATSAEEGIDLACQQRPDVILLDLNLPGIDGFEAVQRLAALPETAHIPVIAVTADAMQSTIERANQSGFSGYLTKPFSVDRLLETLRHAFEGAK